MPQPLDLTQLPPPEVIETLDFEAILAELLSEFQSRYPDYSALLESDPAMKLLEVAAYRELLLRNRINAAARANLIAFAVGSDLDHLAAFYGLDRQAGEDDSRLRRRLQLRIASLAANGTAEHYRLLAMTASPAVRDVGVWRNRPGEIELILRIEPPGAEATALAAIRRALTAQDAQPLGVAITLRQAIWHPVTVRAHLYRQADAPLNLIETLRETLPEALTAYAQIGRDLPRSWLMAQLHRAGVSRVDLIEPAADLILANDHIVAVGEIELIDRGVLW